MSDQAAGASPLFSPHESSAEAACEALLHVVRREPRQLGVERMRWRLADLRQVCAWLRVETDAGMHGVLKRLRIHYKRGRSYTHSPDPAYLTKLAVIKAAQLLVRTHPEKYVLLYLDEMTYYRQPTVDRAYAAAGADQPLAPWAYFTANTQTRVVGTLDYLTGRVLFRQRSHIDIACLVGFWTDIRAAYPNAKLIFVVLDNWTVHFHPDVVAPLAPQPTVFPVYRPGNWPLVPTRLAPASPRLPIRLLPLPTYASWLNPIEKLWRKLRQDELHLHQLADDLPQLRQRVIAFLSQFSNGSEDLRRYVGLLPY